MQKIFVVFAFLFACFLKFGDLQSTTDVPESTADVIESTTGENTTSYSNATTKSVRLVCYLCEKEMKEEECRKQNNSQTITCAYGLARNSLFLIV